MEKNSYIQWLQQWLNKNTENPSINISDNLFETGALNSFQTLTLISAIESHFQMSLSDTIFTDPRFSTMDGIASILTEQNCDKRETT